VNYHQESPTNIENRYGITYYAGNLTVDSLPFTRLVQLLQFCHVVQRWDLIGWLNRIPLSGIVSGDSIAWKKVFLIEPLKEGYFSRALVFGRVFSRVFSRLTRSLSPIKVAEWAGGLLGGTLSMGALPNQGSVWQRLYPAGVLFGKGCTPWALCLTWGSNWWGLSLIGALLNGGLYSMGPLLSGTSAQLILYQMKPLFRGGRVGGVLFGQPEGDYE